MADKSEDAPKPRRKRSAAVKRPPVPKKQVDLIPCGLVMPISQVEPYGPRHWADVKRILTVSALSAGFDLQLVSDAPDVGKIQHRIIDNLFTQEIVICDLSARNPNVMFELGLRYARDKATVIVMDDRTEFIFDVQDIEHVLYPASLNHVDILEFQTRLANKLLNTYKASRKAEYSPFLSSYPKFVIPALPTKTVSTDPYLVDSIKSINNEMSQIRSRLSEITTSTTMSRDNAVMQDTESIVRDQTRRFLNSLEIPSNRKKISYAHYIRTIDVVLARLGVRESDDNYRSVRSWIRSEIERWDIETRRPIK